MCIYIYIERERDLFIYLLMYVVPTSARSASEKSGVLRAPQTYIAIITYMLLISVKVTIMLIMLLLSMFNMLKYYYYCYY